MNLKDKIRTILKTKHLKQCQLAKRIGVSPSRLNNWLHGKSRPNAEWITEKINKLFVECEHKEGK